MAWSQENIFKAKGLRKGHQENHLIKPKIFVNYCEAFRKYIKDDIEIIDRIIFIL